MGHWSAAFESWWAENQPEGVSGAEIYLRTARSGEPHHWSTFSHVRLADYRFGVFFSPSDPGRTIGFGDYAGTRVWQEPPLELRSCLFQVVVSQADTEPAAVEQQRSLARLAPSVVDLRNMLQVNVEEARHMWSMVYLLLRYFGSDGSVEVERLMQRRSGQAEHPRLLDIFNERLDEWLSFFLFTAFADRDGIHQLRGLAGGGFDPLARAARFMLREETHHVSVGVTGIERLIQRSCELMKRDPNEDAARHGGIPLDVLQRYLNYWYPLALDMLGGEISPNAARFFASSIKGPSSRRDRDFPESVMIEVPEGEHLVPRSTPSAEAMNEIVRNAYVRECESVVARWNRVIQQSCGDNFRLRLPHRRFNRRRGLYSNDCFDTEGLPCSRERVAASLPTKNDREHVCSLMVPVRESGRVAHWLAPPRQRIDRKPLSFQFVRP
jgi:benzoyl-CoA 2,3-dioxygenase component B